jgi:hypothetical protein
MNRKDLNIILALCTIITVVEKMCNLRYPQTLCCAFAWLRMASKSSDTASDLFPHLSCENEDVPIPYCDPNEIFGREYDQIKSLLPTGALRF